MQLFQYPVKYRRDCRYLIASSIKGGEESVFYSYVQKQQIMEKLRDQRIRDDEQWKMPWSLLTTGPLQPPATKTMTPTPNIPWLWQGLLPPCLSAESAVLRDEKCGEGCNLWARQNGKHNQPSMLKRRVSGMGETKEPLLQRCCSRVETHTGQEPCVSPRARERGGWEPSFRLARFSEHWCCQSSFSDNQFSFWNM